MSYRALLFCPDETAARLVTQVLSELDFTVELSLEPFVTVKKLTDEQFDAVVVDCSNEDNAALLFKGARNSSLNHSSLCVAVVEGQMGVAKAFRIGANLVLTKPINTEQSKGTLRVARGLLRKSENKPQTIPETPGTVTPSKVPAPSPIISPLPAAAAENLAAAAATSVPTASVKPVTTVPTSLFEAEQERPVAPVGDEKPREKVPAFLIQKPAEAEPSSPSATKTSGERFAATLPTAAAAAPAMSPERAKSSSISGRSIASETQGIREIKTAAPLATQESIVPQKRFPEPSSAHVPTFSSYAQHSSAPSGAGRKIIWTLVFLLLLAPAGYFGWQKLQPLRYLHRAPAIDAEPTSLSSQPAHSDSAPATTAPAIAEPQNGAASVPAAEAPVNSNTPIATSSAPEGFPTKESIDVGQPSDTPEPPITVVPKPEPLQVNQKPADPARSQPTPPSLVLPESKAADSALAGIVSTNVAVPKPAPGALQISEGVTQGLLVKKIAPVYPASALQLRKQGSVQLLATISKTGDIAHVKVLSGEAILAQSAVDAVRQWKYRPFLLNAEPVEIQTQITINFRLPK